MGETREREREMEREIEPHYRVVFNLENSLLIVNIKRHFANFMRFLFLKICRSTNLIFSMIVPHPRDGIVTFLMGFYL